MDKFILEEAQKGKELVTRDGRPARYIAIMQQSNPQFPVVAEVLMNEGEEYPESHFEAGKKMPEEWHMENYSIDGEYLPPFENELDLFIKTL